MSRYPRALRQAPIDRNDREHEHEASFIPWEFSGINSEAAWAAIDYLDDTAWLFRYKGRLVVTDETLELTEAGDGTPVNPIGFPRYTADSMREIEEWLEAVAEDIEE